MAARTKPNKLWTPLSIFCREREEDLAKLGTTFSSKADLLASGIYDEFVSLTKKEKDGYTAKAKAANRKAAYLRQEDEAVRRVKDNEQARIDRDNRTNSVYREIQSTTGSSYKSDIKTQMETLSVSSRAASTRSTLNSEKSSKSKGKRFQAVHRCPDPKSTDSDTTETAKNQQSCDSLSQVSSLSLDNMTPAELEEYRRDAYHVPGSGQPLKPYGRDSFGNRLDSRIRLDQKQHQEENSAQSILKTYFETHKKELLDMKFVFIDFELYYHLADEDVPFLPAEIAIEVFTLRDGFLPNYEVHSFISVEDYLDKTKGLLGDIKSWTDKYNKIPYDREPKWSRDQWRSFFKRICDKKLAIRKGDPFCMFTRDRVKTDKCLSWLAKQAGFTKDFEENIRPGIASWEVLVKSLFDFCQMTNPEIDTPTSMFLRRQWQRPDFDSFTQMRCHFHNEDEVGQYGQDCAKQTVQKMGFHMWSLVKHSLVREYPKWKGMDLAKKRKEKAKQQRRKERLEKGLPASSSESDSDSSKENDVPESVKSAREKKSEKECLKKPSLIVDFQSNLTEHEKEVRLVEHSSDNLVLAKLEFIESPGHHFPVDTNYQYHSVDMKVVERCWEEDSDGEDEVAKQAQVGYSTWSRKRQQQQRQNLDSMASVSLTDRTTFVGDSEHASDISSNSSRARPRGLFARGRGRGARGMRLLKR